MSPRNNRRIYVYEKLLYFKSLGDIESHESKTFELFLLKCHGDRHFLSVNQNLLGHSVCRLKASSKGFLLRIRSPLTGKPLLPIRMMHSQESDV